MKIFTLVSLLLMPPTLIASFFGMNVYFGEFVANSIWAVIIIGALMVLSIVIIFLIFKIRKML
jgi:magnesium transporter